MCYYTQQKKIASELTKFFKREVDNPEKVLVSNFINGFSYPNIPVILDTKPEIITTNFTWGLLPNNRDKDFRKSTLNARVETLSDKVSFSPSINNRCLIIASAYYDWHWNDAAGKSKTKYQINSQDFELFCLAGIYNSWIDNQGNNWNTYSIVTTEADQQMKYIHNRKEAEGDQRMPILIKHTEGQNWLDAKNHPLDFAYPNYKPSIIGFPASGA
ncbi:SOS response-associated peptidase [Flavobacterium sp.]|uniref:SOS response-associated peptidase n=1 Tax=Flavobacterium sp. TaxID=239 RepID=UPI00261F5C9A|nr:SOS response-associated peptidase family protein [Flavobacterium sp.]